MWALGSEAAHFSVRGDLRNFKISSARTTVIRQARVLIFAEIKLKSLILAQIERWRHALHMQVERQRGSNPGGEWRTGE